MGVSAGSLLLRGSLHRPGIKVANSTNASDPLAAVVLRAQLPSEVADVKVDTSIERRELPVENILDQCLARENLPRRIAESMQDVKFRRRQAEWLPSLQYGMRRQIQFDI